MDPTWRPHFLQVEHFNEIVQEFRVMCRENNLAEMPLSVNRPFPVKMGIDLEEEVSQMENFVERTSVT